MAKHYKIRLKGHIDVGWTVYFDGFQSTHGTDGTTELIGPVPDQSALLGLLNRIDSLGLPILLVQNLDYLPNIDGQVGSTPPSQNTPK